MFNLKAKDIYEKCKFWQKYFFNALMVILGIYLFFSFLLFINIKNNSVYLLNLIIGISFSSFLLIFESVFNLILEIVCIKKMTKEIANIINETKLPNKLPKVVFVYTTHNDFWEERLLQSMQQTYKNIEYWISDGSSSVEISKKIQEFARIHDIKYHSMNRPSIHKADNLNHFLKYSNVDFDYLWICDADVAIDKNFVETSLKLFYCKNQKRLGWVSTMLQNCKSNNVFTNVIQLLDNYTYFFESAKNFKMSEQVNLYSAGALIKKEMLSDFNMQFPNVVLEDGWLEVLATKKYWVGVINPLVVSLQEFDKNILAHMNRIFRVEDWGICLFKKNYFKNQNETKYTSYKQTFNSIVKYHVKVSSVILTTSIILFFFINFWDVIFSINEFRIFIAIFTSVVSIGLLSFVVIFCIFNKENCLWFFMFYPFYKLLIFWYSFVRFFNAFYRSKYADFSPSRNKSKTNKVTVFNRIKKFVFVFVIETILLLLINLSFILTKAYSSSLIGSFFFIFLNVLVGTMWLSSYSFFFLYFLSSIKINRKYNKKDFVYCTNKTIIKNNSLI